MEDDVNCHDNNSLFCAKFDDESEESSFEEDFTGCYCINDNHQEVLTREDGSKYIAIDWIGEGNAEDILEYPTNYGTGECKAWDALYDVDC